MKKQRKGITLIALVITIIILLILAAITINLTVGQRGILRRAEEAGRNYQEAAKREDEELSNLWAEAENIIGGTTPNPPEGGSTDPVIPTQPEPSEEVKALKAGNYIKYDTGVTTVGENGVITCRVLYPVDSEYGLQIISNENVGSDISLGGSTWEEAKASYNGAIEKLNSEAEKYVNEAYAYDGRCVGSIPTMKNGMFVDKNKGTEDTVRLPLLGWTSYKRPEGWESDDTGCFGGDLNDVVDKEAMASARLPDTLGHFWLASREVQTGQNGKYGGQSFFVHMITNRCLCICFAYGLGVRRL